MNTNGDGSAYVKYSNGNIVIGAGSADKVTVAAGSTTVANDLTVSAADINAAGGFQRDERFYKLRVLQGSFPMMSASILSAAQGGVEGFMAFTKVPLIRAGSVVGLALLCQDATVKSGSLSGTVRINGTPTAATVGMNTGTIAYTTYTKDTHTFTAGQYLEVQLSASTEYLTDTDPNSGSFMAVVSVEY